MRPVRLNGSKLRTAAYDVRGRRLRIEFADGAVRDFEAVPQEVFERLRAAPNAGAYYDDRIRDEYPSRRGAQDDDAAARGRLDDLFGGQ